MVTLPEYQTMPYRRTSQNLQEIEVDREFDRRTRQQGIGWACNGGREVDL
jgi:hypothetical protein